VRVKRKIILDIRVDDGYIMVEILKLIKCKRYGLKVSGCPWWDKEVPEKTCDLCMKEKKDERRKRKKGV
jgi:hypothetical protein